MINPFSIWVYLSATPLLWLALTLVAWIRSEEHTSNSSHCLVSRMPSSA